MGSRERNYYRDAVSAMGFAGEAAAIADAALAGRRRDAEALVPDAMVEALAVIGDGPAVAERLAALADAGVTTLALTAGTPDPVRVVESLGRLMP
jgi:alkanesulfonate monooxygenase SsuD/methylene tetrahydromethanopterin reductase-like flavin-dependent oxidoreductase (luciferase family)